MIDILEKIDMFYSIIISSILIETCRYNDFQIIRVFETDLKIKVSKSTH